MRSFQMLMAALLLMGLAHAPLARADDDTIFDSRVVPAESQPPGVPEGGIAGQVFATGFKKLPGDDAINQWSVDLETGAVESHASNTGESTWKNLYLAFAVDVRYKRECFGSKTTVLCTLLRSSVELSANLSWADKGSQDRYAVVLVPIEYVTGTFGKEGLDLGNTSSALYATVGARAEYVRDLGLDVQNRVLGVVSAGVNYSSPQQGLGPDAAFRWIGSVRLFAGGGSEQFTQGPQQGTLSGGLETQIGIALDLTKGSLSFTNTTRLEGDLGFGDKSGNAGFLSDRLELKFLRSICRDAKQGGCNAPRVMSYGGGVRYEYDTASYEGAAQDGSALSVDRSVHRLIFFAELARF